MSVVAAMLTKYAAMTFPGGVTKPPIFFDLAPDRDSIGEHVELPWVVLKDRGMRIDYEFEYHPIEVTTAEFQIYHIQLIDADAVAQAVKYGTSASTQAGFDFGTLTMTPQTFKEMKRVNESRDLQTVMAKTVQLVHRVILTYEVEAAYQF